MQPETHVYCILKPTKRGTTLNTCLDWNLLSKSLHWDLESSLNLHPVILLQNISTFIGSLGGLVRSVWAL